MTEKFFPPIQITMLKPDKVHFLPEISTFHLHFACSFSTGQYIAQDCAEVLPGRSGKRGKSQNEISDEKKQPFDLPLPASECGGASAFAYFLLSGFFRG